MQDGPRREVGTTLGIKITSSWTRLASSSKRALCQPLRYMIHRRWTTWQKSRTEVSRCMRIQPVSDNATYWRSGECPMKSARRDSEAIRSQMSRRAPTARNRPSAAEWSMRLVLKKVKIASGCR